MALQLPQMLGADSGNYTPETLARRRKLAETMLGGATGIQDIRHPLQGLAQMLQAGVGGYHMKQADEKEAAERERANKMFAEILAQGSDADMSALMGAAGDPWASDANQRLAQILMGEQLKQNDPLYQQNLERGGLEIEKLRNPEPEPGFAIITNDEAAQLGLPEGGAYQRGPDNKIYEIGGGGTNVSVSLGDGAPGLGKLSTDYGYVLNPETGEPVIDPATGLPTAAAVPGSPAAIAQEEAAARLAAGGEQDTMYADIVSEDIGRALNLLETDPTFTTGLFGQVMGNLKGSSADRLDQFLNTVRSNVAFDRLQAMRESSPTGGALGSITERELALLESTIGSLERSNPEDLAYNLKRVQEVYDRVMEKAAAYPNAGQFGFGGGGGGQSTDDPADIDALLELYK